MRKVDLREVTKIEIYKSTRLEKCGPCVGCIIFYKGTTIIGAPNASGLGLAYDLSTLQQDFIDKCPLNGWKCDQSYEIGAD